ncbi:AAA family ATPase [Flammeovirga sp. OC4]|uniref:AAA family ATPase n=1 Tax=Flammeovirga sp. OC4 TaxID=1382345 RepID=UPI0005C5926C|nr:AAA family ATPase [Flammeovirga sp. OC4]
MNKRVPKYSLEGFNIKNYQGIKEIDIQNLPQASPWIFLTGENGFGKTSVLKALSAFIGKKKEMYLPQATKIAVDIKEYKGKNRSSLPKECVAYGPNRLSISDARSSNDPKLETNLSSLFENTPLLNIESYLPNWYKDQLLALNGIKSSDHLFEQTRNLFLKVMPNLVDMKIVSNNIKDEVVYIEENEPKINKELHQLASGNKSLVAFIGDLLIRLLQQNSTKDIRQLGGIVFIDEMDLHLHPIWQKKLPTLLSEIFPRIQFVASTHSPIPLLGAPEGSVFLKVNRSEEEGITVERLETLETEIKNLLPNTILSSPIFGFNEIFSVQHHKGEKVQTEDTYEDVLKRKKVKEKISKLNPEQEAELKEFLKKRRDEK